MHAEVTCYEGLQSTAISDAIDIFLAQPVSRTYLRAEVIGHYRHPFMSGPYYYALSKGPLPGENTADTFIEVVANIDPATLDPALSYDTLDAKILRQVYDPLILYEREKVDEFIPMLATDWTISPDGMTYTFEIREGVHFHDGSDLTPSDVAYTFQRGILQGGDFTPQWLLSEPLLGTGISDVTYLIDSTGNLVNDRAALQAWAPSQDLVTACNTVQSAIVADDVAGTVTFHLEQGWTPLLATLAGIWGSVIDQQWAVDNGAWDGECSTWQDHYAMTSEEDPLTGITNGTGPYKLGHWYPDDEIQLVRNDAYWRSPSEPMWEGAPGGLAFYSSVVIKEVQNEFARYQWLVNGLADTTTAIGSYYDSLEDEVLLRYTQDDVLVGELVHTDGFLKRYDDTLYPTSSDAFFNFQINAGGPHDYIGSGTLGAGIPSDFFSDIHIRKAFSYAFNYEQFLSDAYGMNVIRRRGPIPAGVVGYSDTSTIYDYNPTQAEAEMGLADTWGVAGTVPSTGFTLTISYQSGNIWRTAMANRLKADIEVLNSNYHINLIELNWEDYTYDRENGYQPIFANGWLADIPSAYNWVKPYMLSFYADSQNLPESMQTTYAGMINACLPLSGSAEVDCYAGVQSAAVADAIDLFLAQPLPRTYLRAEVRGYYENPYLFTLYYYALSEGSLPELDVLDPVSALTMYFSESDGSSGTVDIPDESVTETYDLVITPESRTVGNPIGFKLGTLAFDIQAYLNGIPVDDLTFEASDPVIITLNYLDEDIQGLVEDELALFYWNDTSWEDAACGAYIRDTVANTLTVPICHFSPFAMGGVELKMVFLPLLIK